MLGVFACNVGMYMRQNQREAETRQRYTDPNQIVFVYVRNFWLGNIHNFFFSVFFFFFPFWCEKSSMHGM